MELRAESRVNVLRWLKHVLRYGVNVLRYVMHVLRYGIGCFRHSFRHCEIFSKKIQKILAAPPARIIITARIINTPADNLLRVRILI